MGVTVTISTHMGNKVARQHNIRNRKVTDKEGHIRKDGDHGVWFDVDHREAYRRLFGAAVAKYNEQQSRDDRKIGDYYKQVCKDAKKHPVYEVIVGVYPKDGELSVKEQEAILWQYATEWKKANPHLALVGVYWHADEAGQPHIHMDYIPWSDGYKKGPERQAGLVRALEAQGFHKQGRETAQMQWTRAENNRLEAICRAHGLEVAHPLRGQHSKHIATKDYKYHMAQLQSLAQQVEQFRGAEDIFQWAEDRVNPKTGQTIFEAYCDSQNLDYAYWVEAVGLTPNPAGNYATYRTQ